MHIVFWHPKVWLSPPNYVINLRCMGTPFAVEIIQKQQRPNQQSTNVAYTVFKLLQGAEVSGFQIFER